MQVNDDQVAIRNLDGSGRGVVQTSRGRKLGHQRVSQPCVLRENVLIWHEASPIGLNQSSRDLAARRSVGTQVAAEFGRRTGSAAPPDPFVTACRGQRSTDGIDGSSNVVQHGRPGIRLNCRLIDAADEFFKTGQLLVPRNVWSARTAPPTQRVQVEVILQACRLFRRTRPSGSLSRQYALCLRGVTHLGDAATGACQ